MKKSTILLTILLIAFSVSGQEWTTVGNDIVTTNLGMTVIKAKTGYIGGTRLAIIPPPDNGIGARVTIGDPISALADILL